MKSDIRTINVNPSASGASTIPSPWAPRELQRIDAELTSRVNYSAPLAQAAGQAAAGGLIPASLVPQIIGLTPGLEAKVKLEGDDSAWGWNVGFRLDATPQTRIGGQYRSSIKYNVAANVTFDAPGLPVVPAPIAPVIGLLATNVNGALANGSVKADIELPDIANLSIFHRLNDRWDLMGDVQYTRWSVFKELRFVRTTGALLLNTPENFDNAWRVSAGALYLLLERRVELSRRPCVGPDAGHQRRSHAAAARRRPCLDRRRRAVPVQPQPRARWGFVDIPVKSPDILQNAGSTAANGLIKGNYDASVTIFSAQLTYTF